MPIDPFTGAAIISTVGSGLNSVFNWWAQGKDRDQQNAFNIQQQAAQQQWNQQMWEDQKEFAWDQWHANNQYNSPQMQMARLKEAGLNPHLIYGKGSSGPSAPISTPDVKGYTRAEAANVTRGIDLFGDILRNKALIAQTNNVKTQSDLNKQNALLSAQKTANELINGKQGSLDYEKSKELYKTSVDAAKVALEHETAKMKATNLENKFNEISLNPRVEKVKQELKNLKLDTTRKEFENKLKKWEADLSDSNLRPNDMWILRMIELFRDQVKSGKLDFRNLPKQSYGAGLDFLLNRFNQ